MPQENTLYSLSPEIQTEQVDDAYEAEVVLRGEPQGEPNTEEPLNLTSREIQGEQNMNLLGNSPNGQNTDITTDGSVGSDPAADSHIVPQPTCMTNRSNITVDGQASNGDELAQQIHKELDTEAELLGQTFLQKWDDLILMIGISLFMLCFIQDIEHFGLVDLQLDVTNILTLVLPFRALGFAMSSHSFGQTLLLYLYKNTLYYLRQSGYMQQYIKTFMQRADGKTLDTNHPLKNKSSEKCRKYLYDEQAHYYIGLVHLMAMHAIYDISAIFGAPSSLTLVFSLSRIG